MNKLTNPPFLFCELPVKDGSIQDERAFIYCTNYISLIEVWPLELGPAAWPKEQFQKNYKYFDEDFILVFTQNNVDLVNEQISDIAVLQGKASRKTQEQLMDEAWQFYREYLEWVDSQI